MYYDKQKVIDWAWEQIGYHEKDDAQHLEDMGWAGDRNYNKYAKVLDDLKDFYNGIKQGQMWCDVFVDAGFVICYGRRAAQELLCQPDRSCGAGCSFSAQYFNAHGQFHKSGPQTGDQIFFGTGWDNVYHTGLVVEVSGSTVTTIEGNTSDMVAKRQYPVNDARIFGYGRPNWGVTDTNVGDKEPAEDTNVPAKQEQPEGVSYSVKLPLLVRGCKGGYVKSAQLLLAGKGYSVGPWGADGDYGFSTEAAVKALQKDYGLEIDGELGGQSWAKLLSM